jgi:hypothetical protein
MSIKIENGWAIDHNNNRVDLATTDTATAFAMLKACRGCTNCVNCINCSWCHGCSKCFKCRGCYLCVSCSKCDSCQECRACHNSIDCRNTSACSDCRECASCASCFNLVDCEFCHLCGYLYRTVGANNPGLDELTAEGSRVSSFVAMYKSCGLRGVLSLCSLDGLEWLSRGRCVTAAAA